jgi:hypothetical protein
MTRRWLYELSAKLGRMTQGLFLKDGNVRRLGGFAKLAPPLIAWTSGRDLRPIEQQSFRERWRKELAQKKN